MSADVRATAYHEAAHAVTGFALGHEIRCVLVNPIKGVRYPGRTERVVSGPGHPALLSEECAIVEVIGGLAEIRHDEHWRADAWHRDDDLKDVQERLRNTGSGPMRIDAFMKRCDEIARELLDDEGVWAGIAAVAAHLETTARQRPDAPTRFMNMGRVISRAIPQKSLDQIARVIRGYAAVLNALR